MVGIGSKKTPAFCDYFAVSVTSWKNCLSFMSLRQFQERLSSQNVMYTVDGNCVQMENSLENWNALL